MMAAKLATPGLLKIKLFWNKGYDVIIPVCDVTNKVLSYDSKYIIDVVMRLKFGNSSISIKKVLITFFEGRCWLKFKNLGLVLGMALKLYISVTKRLKIKVKKVWGANSYICRSCRGKTGRGDFLPPPPS